MVTTYYHCQLLEIIDKKLSELFLKLIRAQDRRIVYGYGYSAVVRVLSRIFVWREVDPKKNLEPHSGEKKFV